MVSHWTLRNNKFPEVSRTLLSTLADLNDAVVWRVSTRPLISESSSPFINPLWLYRTYHLQLVSLSLSYSIVFWVFFSSLARFWCLCFFSFSFSFTKWLIKMAKSTIRQLLFFCCLSLGLVVWPRLRDPFISQNLRVVCASHFPGQILGCTYTIYS